LILLRRKSFCKDGICFTSLHYDFANTQNLIFRPKTHFWFFQGGSASLTTQIHRSQRDYCDYSPFLGGGGGGGFGMFGTCLLSGRGFVGGGCFGVGVGGGGGLGAGVGCFSLLICYLLFRN
jgi:hypothetical protein